MQKKFARFSRLFPVVILGLAIATVGLAGWLSQSAPVDQASASDTTFEAYTGTADATGDFGSYNGTDGPAVAGDKISVSSLLANSFGAQSAFVLTAQKLKDECLASKDCVDDSDCSFFDCVSGDPDEKAVFQGKCVNNKCDCSEGALIDQIPCPFNLPRCYVLWDGLGNSTGTQCGQCNDNSDCPDKAAKCNGKILVTYAPACKSHVCAYDEANQQCPNGCAIVDGEAKCVGCTTNNQCPQKPDACEGNRKVSFKAVCQNNSCDNIETTNQDCGNRFCYQADPDEWAKCVDCFQDNQCGNNGLGKKCLSDRRSYTTLSYKCNKNFKCDQTQGPKQICQEPTPYCQNGNCVECQRNTDCSAKLPKSYCSDETTRVTYSLNGVKCTKDNKCDLSKAWKKQACPNKTYCKDNKGNLSCVQCLSNENCSYLKPSYTCVGNALVGYGATCDSKNKCNAKGKETSRLDCKKLSCSANKGKCVCTSASQCTDVPDKKSTCVNGTQYKQYTKACDRNSGDCGYNTKTYACGKGKVCQDTAEGAKCVGCQKDTDCSYLAQDPQYQTRCAGQTVTSWSFKCQQSSCIANKSENYCKNGCYKDNKGRSLCKDCDSSTDCVNPPAASCSSTYRGISYKNSGSCTQGRCEYAGIPVNCGNVPITSACKGLNTRIVYGPGTKCQASGTTASCKAESREEQCFRCRKQGSGTFCMY